MFYRRPSNELSLSETFNMINPLLDEVRGIPARGPPKNYSEIQRQPLSPNEGSGSRRIEPSYGGSYGGIPRPQMEIRPTHDQNYNKNSYFETRSQETAKFKESVPFEQVQSEVRSHPETENQNGITLNQNIELESQKTDFSKRDDLIGREKALELAERALVMTERSLQEQSSKFREKKQGLKEDIKKWETAYREMREREKDAVAEKNKAIEQINKMTEESQKKEEIIRQLEDGVIREMREKCEQLEKKVISEGTARQKVETQWTSKFDELQMELQRAQEANQCMSKKLKEAIEYSIESEKLASQKEVERVKLIEKIAELQEKAKQQEDSEGKWEQEVKRLTQQLAVTKEENIKQTTQLTELIEKQTADFRKKEIELETLKEEVFHSRAEIISLQVKNETLLNQQSHDSAILKDSEGKLEQELQRASQQLTMAREEIQELQLRSKTTRERCDRLEEALEQKEHVISQKEKERIEETRELTQRLMEAQKENDEREELFKGAVMDYEKTIEDLRVTLLEKEGVLLSLQENLERIQSQLSEKNKENKEMKSQQENLPMGSPRDEKSKTRSFKNKIFDGFSSPNSILRSPEPTLKGKESQMISKRTLEPDVGEYETPLRERKNESGFHESHEKDRIILEMTVKNEKLVELNEKVQNDFYELAESFEAFKKQKENEENDLKRRLLFHENSIKQLNSEKKSLNEVISRLKAKQQSIRASQSQSNISSQMNCSGVMNPKKESNGPPNGQFAGFHKLDMSNASSIPHQKAEDSEDGGSRLEIFNN